MEMDMSGMDMGPGMNMSPISKTDALLLFALGRSARLKHLACASHGPEAEIFDGVTYRGGSHWSGAKTSFAQN
jgi:hypothetical protein